MPDELVSVEAEGNEGATAYEIERLEGTVKRETLQYKNGEVVAKIVDEEAGFMAYFPNGNSVRIRDEAELRRLGFRVPPVEQPESKAKAEFSKRDKSRKEVSEVKEKFKETN